MSLIAGGFLLRCLQLNNKNEKLRNKLKALKEEHEYLTKSANAIRQHNFDMMLSMSRCGNEYVRYDVVPHFGGVRRGRAQCR